MRGASTILRAAAFVGLACVGVACGSERAALLGYVPPSIKNVANSTGTEVAGGRTVEFPFRAADGEMLVVFFGYTNCPDVCPATLTNLKNAKKKLGALAESVDIAMVTVDPARDTTEILPRYLSSFTERFHAIVPADDAELRALEDAFQATSSVTVTNGRVEVTHSGTAYVVDDAGNVVVEWPFGIDVPSMVNDLTILLDKEESNT